MVQVHKVVEDGILRDPQLTTPYEIIYKGIFTTPMQFHAVIVNVDMARDLLMYNREPKAGHEGTNRKASPVRVEIYAKQILAREWELSPQPIIFSEADDGGLVMQLDGQQRLKALLLAAQTDPDICAPFTICIDAPVRSQAVMDLGKPRSPADYMRMYGHRDPVVLSAAVRMLHCYENVKFQSVSHWTAQKMSPQQERAFLAEHPSLVQAVAEAKRTKMLVIPRVAAVAWYLLQEQYGPFVASQFMSGLEKGQNMDGTDARYRLREYLSRQKMIKYVWDGYEQLALLLMASASFLVGSEKFVPAKAFSKVSKTFPGLIPLADLPDDVKVRFADDLPKDAFQ